MSLKEALMQYKESKADKEITEKIEAMLAQQKALLDTALDINKDGDIIKVKKEWDDGILTDGGVSYYKMNDNYPGVSWSSVDYYGAIKPVHYFVQKSFAPLTGVLLFDRTNLSSQEVSLPLYLLDDCRRLNGKDYTVSVTVYNDRLDTVVCREFN